MASQFRIEKLEKSINNLKAQYSDLMKQAFEFGVGGANTPESNKHADACRSLAQGIRMAWIQLENDFNLGGM